MRVKQRRVERKCAGQLLVETFCEREMLQEAYSKRMVKLQHRIEVLLEVVEFDETHRN